MSPRVQVSRPAVIEQDEASWLSIVQAVPASVGSVSVATTPLASPGPGLLTTIVKPIVSPAETLWSSATLVTAIWVPRTSTWSLASSLPSLLVVTWTLLLTGESGTVSLVVGELGWRAELVLEAKSARVQVIGQAV